MLSTFCGTTMSIKFLPAKAYAPMLVTLSGKIVFVPPNTKVLLSVSIIPLHASLLSYFSFSSATCMSVKLSHPLNASFAIFVTLLEMLKFIRLSQSPKAPELILVTSSGIINSVSSLQPQKALLPMFVTLLGIFVFLHPKSRVLLLVSIIPLQLSLLSYFSFPFATRIDDRLSQNENASPLISITLLGISILSKLEQRENALYPIFVTLFGIFTFFKPEQLKNAEYPISVTPFCMSKLSNSLQPRKAHAPIVTTFFGTVTLVSPQYPNANPPI